MIKTMTMVIYEFYKKGKLQNRGVVGGKNQCNTVIYDTTIRPHRVQVCVVIETKVSYLH